MQHSTRTLDDTERCLANAEPKPLTAAAAAAVLRGVIRHALRVTLARRWRFHD